jgi:hypothetical protein
MRIVRTEIKADSTGTYSCTRLGWKHTLYDHMNHVGRVIRFQFEIYVKIMATSLK